MFSEITLSVEGKSSLTINFREENILSSAHVSIHVEGKENKIVVCYFWE